MKSGQSQASREAILRGVYEDNLRTVRRGVAPAEAPRTPRRRRAAAWVPPLAVLAAVVVGIVGGLAYQSFSAGPAGGERGASVGQRTGQGSGLVHAETTLTTFGQAPPAPAPGLAGVLGLAVKTIVIDPGHGGRDPGAIGAHGVLEKDVTLDVARRLKTRLEAYGYRILLTRAWDAHVPLKSRAAFANEHGADLFVSLHVNALPEAPLAPIETYYFGPRAADAAATRLAEVENRESGLSVGEFNRLLQDLGQTLKLQESKALAVSIQKSLYRNMRRINPGVTDWGVKAAPFVVLLAVEAPSVLAEMAVLSNEAEEERLGTAAHREQLAQFLEEGIVAYLQPPPPADPGVPAFTEGASTHAPKKIQGRR